MRVQACFRRCVHAHEVELAALIGVEIFRRATAAALADMAIATLGSTEARKATMITASEEDWYLAVCRTCALDFGVE